MTKYLEPKFSVNVGGPAYSDGWERIFGGDKDEAPFESPESSGAIDCEPAEPLGLVKVQRRIREWAAHNFPDKPSWQPLLGVSEEVGELCHAHLKNAQGIRGTPEQWEAAKKDAVGDIMIYLFDYCNKEGLDAEECLNLALDEISQRDWVRFPLNGRTA